MKEIERLAMYAFLIFVIIMGINLSLYVTATTIRYIVKVVCGILNLINNKHRW